MNNPYQQIDIETASPVQLIVKLYEGAIRFIRTGAEHQSEGRVKERCVSLGRALDIVAELRRSLDMERGGEISYNLDRLYEFASERILEANSGGREEALDEAIRALDPVLDAWRRIASGEVEQADA